MPITVFVTPSGYGDVTRALAPTVGTWRYAVSGDTRFDVQVSGLIVSGAPRNSAYPVTLITAP